MSGETSAQAGTEGPVGIVIPSTGKRDDEGATNILLSPTTEVKPTEERPKNDEQKPSGESRDEHAGKDVAPEVDMRAIEQVPTVAEAVKYLGHKTPVDGGGKSASTSSSIWSTAAATLKNLVIGKPQLLPSGIVPVVPAPGARRDSDQNAAPSASKIDKGKAKAMPHGDAIDYPFAQEAEGETKSPCQRPAVPPSRLSSITHSAPTSYATVPSPQSAASASQNASTRSPSIQAPQSATSSATATSATTATDEENQAAALSALNAVIHSVGTGYTQPLLSRAAQLHANDLMLAQQREKLLRETSWLAKDTAALQKLALESNNKLKGFGDLKNWTETLDTDLSAIEMTLRIVDSGSLKLCAECGEGIADDGHQRWCGVCGKGFHEVCAPPGPEEEDSPRMPCLDDDYDDEEEIAPQPHDLPLPDSLPSTAQGMRDVTGPSVAKEFGTTPPTIPFSQPSVPKPSSMFEWGGIPDAIKDIAALRGGEFDSGSDSRSGSDWSGEDWRCQECRLKADLDDIVGGL